MNNLRTFLDVLRREREIVEIDVPVSTDLEIAEIHRRVVASGGPALLFRQVDGSDFPCVTNLFGTPKRVDLAFGRRPGAFIDQLVGLAQQLPSLSPRGLWGHRGLAREALRVGMKRVSRGPLASRQNPVDLERLPLLKTWPEDGGHFVTLPLVYTEHPETGHHNLGMYRIQRYNANTTGVHWQIQKGGGFHYHVAESRDQPLPLTIFVGGPPALILAAIGPLPEDMPELILASLLQGERLRRTSSLSDHPHPLIAEAEFAIQGYVPPHTRRPEGPFGDHYGYYSLEHDYPVLEVEEVFHRPDAIFPATVVGKPPQEDLYLGDYIQKLMAPLSRLVMPSIHSIWSYGETGYHSLSSIVVRERYPREAMKFAFRILGEDGGQLTLTKFLIVYDEPALAQDDIRQVLEYVLARCHFETDLFLLANLAMDSLDYAGPAINEGSKGILLGVGEPVRELPHEFRGELPAGASQVQPYCAGVLTVSGPTYSEDAEFGQRLAADGQIGSWPLVFLVDDTWIVERQVTFLWSTFTRFEPAADVYAARSRLHRHHEVLEGPIVFDCRSKPGYPDELVADHDTVKKVSRRWSEYFPEGGVLGDEDPFGYAGFLRLP
ncbi:MAG TPA: UbiD family decarboxylase [Candidatus Latescibacteria bacterium]|nr:4-hydroxybenzoate decarboxylase [Gemmatimonadota bacterium]MDP7362310.1 UbiD family decarboxylase [Candidatus Latescibacterota bacterium]MDP7633803.1 UbiD family decarboxylase [Candidatus Latescibacterota bacterium]HCV22583.1 4-hydroxybenzoate decarboxylase [Candidatus Latescibacterota bacterium]HJN29402.1 UbiD family decarboxylase [Candidatus Latescibacterota bacterium]